jgi:hypothetical protein
VVATIVEFVMALDTKWNDDIAAIKITHHQAFFFVRPMKSDKQTEACVELVLIAL